jgi:hypothetical protein
MTVLSAEWKSALERAGRGWGISTIELSVSLRGWFGERLSHGTITIVLNNSKVSMTSSTRWRHQVADGTHFDIRLQLILFVTSRTCYSTVLNQL